MTEQIEQQFRERLAAHTKNWWANPEFSYVELSDEDKAVFRNFAEVLLSTTIDGYCLAIVKMEGELPYSVENSYVSPEAVKTMKKVGYTHKIVKVLGKGNDGNQY